MRYTRTSEFRPLSIRTTIRIPAEIRQQLEQQADEEDCSMSWIVTRSLMKELNFWPENVYAEGVGIKKTYQERTDNPGEWAGASVLPNATRPENKKNGKGPNKTKKTKEATEEKTTREMLEFHCASCGVHVRTWKHSPSKEAQDIIKSGLCMKCYSTA